MSFWRFGNCMIRTESIEAIIFEADKVSVHCRSGRFFQCPKAEADQWLRSLVDILKIERQAQEAVMAFQPPTPPDDTRIGDGQT